MRLQILHVPIHVKKKPFVAQLMCHLFQFILLRFILDVIKKLFILRILFLLANCGRAQQNFTSFQVFLKISAQLWRIHDAVEKWATIIMQ